MGYIWILICASLCSCLTPTATRKRSSNSTEGNTVGGIEVAPGPRAVKIIFKQANPAGSFSAPPTGGTKNEPGSGQPAIRVFNADGSLLATGTQDSNWPQWLKLFEVGVSGPDNAAAKASSCARFAAASETSSSCNFNAGTDNTFDSPCGATEGLYRVSEFDCVSDTITNGTGGPNDGVYLRAIFNRNTSALSAHENILAVLEYAASSLNPAPGDPSRCFQNGLFDPTQPQCSDLSWQIFMKHQNNQTVQPYLLLIPPAFGHVDSATNRGGTGVATKQFYLPLASDPNISVLQISRIRSLDKASPNFEAICKNPAQQAANSPLCVGVIFYSITFYRI